jgi:hypothetical protein
MMEMSSRYTVPEAMEGDTTSADQYIVSGASQALLNGDQESRDGGTTTAHVVMSVAPGMLNATKTEVK